MLIRIEANTIRKKEIRPGFARYCGLDPPDWLRDGPKLQSPNAGGRQQRREDHMVPRRHANDVVYIGVQAFHEPAPGPTRAQDHHPGLLARLRGAQTRVLGRRLRSRSLMDRSRLRAEAREQSVRKWV